MAEKFTGATQTKVATKVSTTTKVLLALLIVGSAAGVFAFMNLNLKGIINNPVTPVIPEEIKSISLESIGATKPEQYNNVAKMTGLTPEVVQACVENGSGCPDSIRRTFGTACTCSAVCTYGATMCGGSCDGQSCTVTCNPGPHSWTKTGRCREQYYVKIGNWTFYF